MVVLGMSESDKKLILIFKLIQDIWNSHKNVLLVYETFKFDQKICIEILFIRRNNTIIARYDEFDEKYFDATDLYKHSVRSEFAQLQDAISFILRYMDLNKLYDLFEMNYGRRFRKINNEYR